MGINQNWSSNIDNEKDYQSYLNINDKNKTEYRDDSYDSYEIIW